MDGAVGAKVAALGRTICGGRGKWVGAEDWTEKRKMISWHCHDKQSDGVLRWMRSVCVCDGCSAFVGGRCSLAVVPACQCALLLVCGLSVEVAEASLKHRQPSVGR